MSPGGPGATPLESLMSKYIILDDGQFRWPASREAVVEHLCAGPAGLDLFSDEGLATAGAIPAELQEECGVVGSKECAALCDRLYEDGAEIIRAQ